MSPHQSITGGTDKVTPWLVYASLLLLIIETQWSLSSHWNHSLHSPRVFLYSERIIAALLTVGFLIRIQRSGLVSKQVRYGMYPLNLFGLIDVVAVAPFLIGFLLPTSWLGLIRSFRVLRVLMLLRNSLRFQYLALKYYRAWHNARCTLIALGGVACLFALVFLELEKQAQPENLKSLVDVIWFVVVTGTTVGYGDIYPVTNAGRLFTGFMLIPLVGSIGMLFSAFAEADTHVQSLQSNRQDPIPEFHTEYERGKSLNL